MPAVNAFPAWLLLLLAGQVLAGAGAPQLWQCAPCSAEKLALCPPVPASCPESARPAGCGCCPMCTLPLGAACGMTTARCARELSCRALPGEPQPLQALIRGKGTCQPQSQAADPSTEAAGASGSSEHMEMTQEPPTLWNTVSNYNSIRTPGITDVNSWKRPCQQELHTVLDRLAQDQETAGGSLYRFYLPNCDRSGLYHSKQCEASLDGEPGLCWCVYPQSGRKIPGSEVRGDPDCQQYFQ
ncbi:insulin-like growth factor-binding protein 1 [Molossus molossus]|uniref:Insulin-like growth factor-binding protein 1 n=2 Tax=Molossus molossus TaxID=27622 RepID=A0A7J8HBG5_MOLMO|nr:insulin-like growth factor-binding protein 1 [Molossus molossus]KAF6469603.1 insulin like growth factor binding protein 1 [Molossus molossus]